MYYYERQLDGMLVRSFLIRYSLSNVDDSSFLLLFVTKVIYWHDSNTCKGRVLRSATRSPATQTAVCGTRLLCNMLGSGIAEGTCITYVRLQKSLLPTDS